jgi:CxxC-x17-CxxC domain-containing protein
MFKPRNDKFSNKSKGGGKFDGKFGSFNKSRDKGFGGGFNKGRDRGGRDFGGGGWDREERAVFDAVCDRCGSPCTVPFKPTGSRPVLCKSCFKQEGDAGPKRFGRDRERPSFHRDDRDFRKGGGFNKGGDFRKSRDSQPDLKGLERQLADINRKLDRLMDALAPQPPQKKKKGGKKKEEPAVIEEVDEDKIPAEGADDLAAMDNDDDDDDLDDEEDFDDENLDDDAVDEDDDEDEDQ